MWFIQPKKDYTAEMPWERLDEPERMCWQIRVRDYNVKAANFIFICIVAVSACASLGFGVYDYIFKGQDVFLFIGLGVFFFITPFFMGMTHQTSIIVYRLTDGGYEKISWKPQIDSVKPVLKWTAIVSGVAVFIGALYQPAILMGMVGPAGMGLMALGMGSSKGYQKLVRDDQHENFDWEEVEEIAYWDKRRLIGLKMSYISDEGQPYSIYQKIYCTQGKPEECLKLVRDKAPSVEYVERKLTVYESFAT